MSSAFKSIVRMVKTSGNRWRLLKLSDIWGILIESLELETKANLYKQLWSITIQAWKFMKNFMIGKVVLRPSNKKLTFLFAKGSSLRLKSCCKRRLFFRFIKRLKNLFNMLKPCKRSVCSMIRRRIIKRLSKWLENAWIFKKNCTHSCSKSTNNQHKEQNRWPERYTTWGRPIERWESLKQP